MKSAGKARSNGLYRHIRTSKEIIRNLLNDSIQNKKQKEAIRRIFDWFLKHVKNTTYCKLNRRIVYCK